ncbi:ZIP family metal transporter [Candidatus Micrarchaeota archaeon]|nr:ZIP family metal transporter [Candidatus Micrarchaeota archaeon]
MLFEILLATTIVSLISLVGVVLITLNKKTTDALIFIIVSFATGSMLSAAFFDLFPEAIQGLNMQLAFALALAGILCFFILERLIHWHHKHHDHEEHEKPITYLVLFGDVLHNFFDGIAIAASFMTNVELGITTTLAIILHEIPQELSDFTLLTYGGFSNSKALIFNFISALTAIVGALSFFYLSSSIDNFKFYGLAFTAGTFIYMAGTDLMPELHKEQETKKAILQLISMIAGIITIWFMTSTLKV